MSLNVPMPDVRSFCKGHHVHVTSMTVAGEEYKDNSSWPQEFDVISFTEVFGPPY